MKREQIMPFLGRNLKVSVHVLGRVEPIDFFGRLVSLTERVIELDNGSGLKEISLEEIVAVCIDRGCRGDQR